MPNIPATPTPPGGGHRQRRAAEIRAEQERAARSQAPPQAPPAAPAENEPLVVQTPEDTEQDAEPLGAGPVGTGEYLVAQGECMSSIANKKGFFWKTIWNDPQNSELKSRRRDPNVLLPGDLGHIPELRRKEDPGATEQRHRFRRRGEPAKFVLRMLRADGTPRARVPYTVRIGSTLIAGETDAKGMLSHFIPPRALEGKLLFGLNNPAGPEEYVLQFGCLDPLSEPAGAIGRLSNLGALHSNISPTSMQNIREVIKGFQRARGLTVTGTLDADTQDKLRQEHGC